MAPEAAHRLAAVLGVDLTIEPGQALPHLWHWAYFPEPAGMAGLGPDGHPRRDDRWALTHPKRVAGGGRVRAIASLLVGEEAERRSELVQVKERGGRTGPVVICDWQHTYTQGNQSVLEETQTVIYRQARGQRHQLLTPQSHTDTARGQLTGQLRFDPVLLFRFSAVTWNAHRIHYDRTYATEIEGYPGLVVHGPLLAILLARQAEEAVGALEELEFRYESPVFDHDTVEIYLERSPPNTCRVEARTGGGVLATTLSARGVGASEPERRAAQVDEGGRRSNG